MLLANELAMKWVYVSPETTRIYANIALDSLRTVGGFGLGGLFLLTSSICYTL
jgi:hypothetical protein